MIQIHNLDFSIHDVPILKNINLEIPKKGITALIGPNGAGKSTLFSLMARLTPITQGKIFFDDLDIEHSKPGVIARKLAILTQENAIHSRITVKDLLIFGRYPYHKGRPQKEDLALIDDAIIQFNLENLSNRYITALSGGQRQRVLIAMIFCQSTEYMLLDEPLNNLDIFHSRELMKLLRRLTDKHDRTTVVVLHDINQAAAYADHIVAMKNGQVLFTGHPNDVITEENIFEIFNVKADIITHKNTKLVAYF